MCKCTRAAARKAAWRRSGFTLIELLVVVAIIALLISILLPSLSGAREQTKMVKCLSNLRQIGTAMVRYFQDNNDWFPHEKRNGISSPTDMRFTGVYYGGHPGRPGAWVYDDVAIRDTPAGRPFNPYIYPDAPDFDIPPTDAQFDSSRNMPIFYCPSDTGGVFAQDSQGDGEPTRFVPMYWEWGTSYDANYHFLANWAIPKSSADYRWMQRANAFLKVQMRRYASIFIMIYEDPFDYAMWNHVPRRGWHKQWNKHSFVFLDGHANNMVTDTGRGTTGTGWKSCSGNRPGDLWAWWVRFNDPDYKYKDIVPLPGS